jgi:hypothetical protein
MNMHVRVPGTPQDSRARRLATQERKRVKTLQRLAILRREAKDEIDRLIRFLDQTDTYALNELEACDAEDDDTTIARLGRTIGAGVLEDDEPSLCGITAEAPASADWRDMEEDRSNDEPSLAAPENHPNCWASQGSQAHWAGGNRDDREGDDCADDREGDELLHGGEAVHEDDEDSDPAETADTGIADYDGLMEQVGGWLNGHRTTYGEAH